MARGNFPKRKSSKSGYSKRPSYGRKSGSSGTRRSSGRRTSGGSRQSKQVIEHRMVVELVQTPGASVANPQLPIPPSVAVDKKRKARL